MKPYDIFIPITNKDYNKLKFLLRSIKENLTGYEGIYVTSPEGDIVIDDPSIKYFKDRDILDVDPRKSKHRPGWIYQMLLKMFQRVTPNDFYLTIDSDVVFNRHMDMFTSDGRPILWMGWEQNHRPYFEFQEKMLGLGREFDHTFINDMNFFSRSVIDDMLNRFGFTVETFCDKTFELITSTCYPAEPEIYGQYVWKYFRGMYEFRQAKTLAVNPRSQNHIQNTKAMVWTDEELEAEIQKMKSEDLDMFMLHSWLDNNIYDWKV